MPLTIRTVAHASADYDAAVALRRRILRTPLGLDFTADQLAAEAGDVHFVAFQDSEVVATVVLTPYDDQTFKLRQMAVEPSLQGRKIGEQMLAAAEDHALRNGRPHITLAARVTAQAFYQRNGYATEGEIYSEVTLPHIRMQKDLTKDIR